MLTFAKIELHPDHYASNETRTRRRTPHRDARHVSGNLDPANLTAIQIPAPEQLQTGGAPPADTIIPVK